MVWTPPRKNPIWHLRGTDKTLCGKNVGRCYVARGDQLPTCKKCIAAAPTGDKPHD